MIPKPSDPAHAMRGRRSPVVAGAPWQLRYMGIPFVDRARSFEAADCRGLVFLILEHERGVRVPEPAEIYAANRFRSAEQLLGLYADEAHRWRRLAEPAAWSVLLFGVRAPSGNLLPAHLGLAGEGGAFIHTQAGYGVQMSHLDRAERGEAHWGARLMGAYVYDA